MKKIILGIVLSAFFLGCTSNEPSNNTASVQEISLNVVPKVNGQNATINSYYALKNGDSIMFSRFDFYMQSLEFKDKTGKTMRTDSVFLYSNKNTSNKVTSKSTSLPTTIDTISFLCGLGDITNSLDPNNYPASHPLSSWKNMYWTMGSKYRFVVLEGNIKTAAGVSIPYSFHTGLTYKYTAKLPVNIILNVNTPKTSNLIINIERVFYPLIGENVKYKENETQAHGDASDGPLTDKVALNFSRAFSLE